MFKSYKTSIIQVLFALCSGLLSTQAYKFLLLFDVNTEFIANKESLPLCTYIARTVAWLLSEVWRPTPGVVRNIQVLRDQLKRINT